MRKMIIVAVTLALVLLATTALANTHPVTSGQALDSTQMAEEGTSLDHWANDAVQKLVTSDAVVAFRVKASSTRAMMKIDGEATVTMGIKLTATMRIEDKLVQWTGDATT